MDNAKSQLVERINTANSVLITVSSDPSVDQLAACIALTLLVNKLNKHGSAVFSGRVPSTIEFLKPEDTLEKSADSLRDFIIALDKNKADKLRYKVEDQMVKIFITPYRTSLNEKDFEFSQGDYNIDLIVALGVHRQEDLDQALVSHGRILHDATIVSINTNEQGNLGTINWQEPTASSLCELVTDLATALGDDSLDEQIATALLTGIIAETDRFSNDKTSPQTMSVSAKLMAAGANQQLVASNLNNPPKKTEPASKEPEKPAEQKKPDDGTLTIDHEAADLDLSTLPKPSGPDEMVPSEPVQEQAEARSPEPTEEPKPPKLVTEPPKLGGKLTANSEPESYDPAVDPLNDMTLKSTADSGLSDNEEPVPAPSHVPPLPDTPVPVFTPPPANWSPSVPSLPGNPGLSGNTQNSDDGHRDLTLSELDAKVREDKPGATPDINAARAQVDMAATDVPQPTQALNAMPLGGPLHQPQIVPTPPPPPPVAPIAPNNTGLNLQDNGDLTIGSGSSSSAPPVAPPLPIDLTPKKEDNPPNP